MNNISFYYRCRSLLCLFFLGFCLPNPTLFAKSLTLNRLPPAPISGTVTDGSSPLPGVPIFIKNNKANTTISDYSGEFSISAQPYDTLVVSFMGFKTAYIPVSNRKSIAIVLQYDTTTLKEVRVNAGYYTVKESESTGNIARITAKDIENQPVTNVLATMQGRMAGVSITQTTGTPGGGFDIKIRGQNSLRFGANTQLFTSLFAYSDSSSYTTSTLIFGRTQTGIRDQLFIRIHVFEPLGIDN